MRPALNYLKNKNSLRRKQIILKPTLYLSKLSVYFESAVNPVCKFSDDLHLCLCYTFFFYFFPRLDIWELFRIEMKAMNHLRRSN